MRLLLVALLICPLTSFADVAFSPLFRDHAILQRDRVLPIWGSAQPGETVTVRLRQQIVETTTASDGRWQVILTPEPFTETPAELTASAPSGTATATDIWLGDVWLCSGQSNMEWPVSKSQNPGQEIAAAHFPLIRHLDLPNRKTPLPGHGFEASWQICSPETVGNFTAVGYAFARELHTRNRIPIGLVNATWGGTAIEVWMSPASLADPALAFVDQRWQKVLAAYPEVSAAYERDLKDWEKEKQTSASLAATTPAPRQRPRPAPPEGPDHPWPSTPSSLYNSMIEPLTPCALRGVIWYQGESNAGRPDEYLLLFRTLITRWRAHFGNADLPFYFVQLASFNPAPDRAAGWPKIRAAQTETLSLPHTGMAVTIDIGDPKDIHPKNKREVGRRLALIAREKIYGEAIDSSGPVIKSARLDVSRVILEFSHAENGLTSSQSPQPSFELAGDDGVFSPAAATLQGNTVVLTSPPELPNPTRVRYVWSACPAASLYDDSGLPAGPFSITIPTTP